MATFKVGQRVRVLPCPGPYTTRKIWREGDEGVIAFSFNHPSDDSGLAWWTVDTATEGPWQTREDYMAPLTDPAADAFMERLKKLEREPAPLVRVVA